MQYFFSMESPGPGDALERILVRTQLSMLFILRRPMNKIKGTVQFGKGSVKPIDTKELPMDLSIEDLADICVKKGVRVKITLSEANNG